MTTIAVMQPYFMPYLGYFRLLSYADVFVAFDCVQFPRRGWVHRNRLLDSKGSLAWLTLPIRRASRDALICDLLFDDRADTWWASARNRFPTLRSSNADRAIELAGAPRTDAGVAQYLVSQIERLSLAFEAPTPVIRSSALKLPAELRGQDRILAICKLLGATRYLNAPGGRALYDTERFREVGVELAFLEAWDGPMASCLELLATEGEAKLASALKRSR